MSRQVQRVAVGCVLAGVLFAVGAGGGEEAATKVLSRGEQAVGIEKAAYGKTEGGDRVEACTCTNASGLVLKLADYGATVVAVETPDKAGKLANITLGFKSLDGYLQRHPYFGATVGRYGNRIAKGKFTLDGKEYKLATNNGPNH